MKEAMERDAPTLPLEHIGRYHSAYSCFSPKPDKLHTCLFPNEISCTPISLQQDLHTCSFQNRYQISVMKFVVEHVSKD
ncbi:hypothetical protein E2C01_009301 [Portunus trituberculatus]|uniref:Uncharacterized protein n=1 Tax=Portunus trituberculatus TaxID=210409 RepID=A0A5B7D5G0_PORTR|nr:hypothetical protein [Portunus trituberculatus]